MGNYFLRDHDVHRFCSRVMGQGLGKPCLCQITGKELPDLDQECEWEDKPDKGKDKRDVVYVSNDGRGLKRNHGGGGGGGG